MTDNKNNNSPATSAWSPLAQPVFRALWIATVASYIGTWMQDVGAGWLMATLAPSPLMVALVQAAATLPMFLLALPAGALADIVDRRRLLLIAQGWMLCGALLLGVLTLLGLTTPWALLACTFLIGLGAALNAPAWQAITPELVGQKDLPAAVALGSMGVNVSRAIGPALGGLVITTLGPAMPFLLNSISFLGVMIVLARWHREPPQSGLPAERLLAAMRAGVRFVLHAPELKAVLVRTASFVIPASAFWALLPLVAKREMGLGPGGYGLLLAAFGVGAVGGGFLLPGLRRRLGIDLLSGGAVALFAASLLILALVRRFAPVCLVMPAAGAAWLILLASFNTAAQTAVPTWVRARAMAVYFLLFFFGSMAVGSIFWGAVATRAGIFPTLIAAAAALLLGLPVIPRFRLQAAEGLNLAPSLHWPAPAMAQEPDFAEGPVLVTVEYRISPERAADFVRAMDELRLERRRNGAARWRLFRDPGEPGRYLETFLVDTWGEHLRHHERVTVEDRNVQEKVRIFHIEKSPPLVTHLVMADTSRPKT
jgi:MFS family permease